jgi:hypothetical protein
MKNIKLIFVSLSILTFVFAGNIDFEASLTVTSGDNSQELTFGFSPDATDSYDEGLDINATGDISLEWDGTQYEKQILLGDENDGWHEYIINYQYPNPESEGVQLTWNYADWGTLGSFEIISDGSAALFEVNMLDPESATFASGDVGSIDTSDPNNPVLTVYHYYSMFNASLVLRVKPIVQQGIEAIAGENQTVEQGHLVQLDASESIDVTGNGLEYLWTAPDGVILSDISAIRPTFTAPDNQEIVDYEFELIVSQGDISSASDNVTITVNLNQPPTSIAGDRIQAYFTDEIKLNGMGSHDINYDYITYLWTVPEGVDMPDPTVAQPIFTIQSEAMDVDIETGEYMKTNFEFILVVSDINADGIEVLNSTPESVIVEAVVDSPAPPTSPNVYVRVEHEKIILNWDKVAEESIDPFTRYSDFEGYKIYRSTDGGVTWGDENDRIYDYAGEFLGWEPIAQFDLTISQDERHYIDSNTYCEESNINNCERIRGREFSGLDSLSISERFNLGDNTGLTHTFIDTTVYDGVEYTYAVTAYDFGLHTFTDTYNDTTGNGYSINWASTNPDHYIGPGGNGLAAKECLKGLALDAITTWDSNEEYIRGDAVEHSNRFWIASDSIVEGNEEPQETQNNVWIKISNASSIWYSSIGYELNNIVEFDNQLWIASTAIEANIEPGREESNPWDLMYPNLIVKVRAGFSASNITYPDIENADTFVESNDSNSGNGPISLAVINELELTDNIVKIEIQAELTGNLDVYESLKTENPEIYIYEIESIENPILANYNTVLVSDLTGEDIEYYLDLPGSEYSVDQSEINYPSDYKISGHTLKSFLSEGYENNWTEFFDGIRMRMDNGVDDFYSLYNGYVLMKDKFGYVDGELDTAFTAAVATDLFYTGSNILAKRPPYSYKIEFSHSYIDIAFRSNFRESCEGTPFHFVDPDDPEKFISQPPLPFKITNLTTGKKVNIQLVDKGSLPNAEDGGEKDCAWQWGEQLAMIWDEVETSENPEEHYEYMFDMFIDWHDPEYSAELWATQEWDEVYSYSSGEIVRHAFMKFKASADIEAGVLPTQWIGESLDINENPWVPQYPWEDGSYVIIEPLTWFADGDSWVADLSILGASHEVTQEELEMVKVVPNPFLVNSGFSEDKEIHFTNLPQECLIQIYTVTGEFVTSINYSGEFMGEGTWNLTNEHGQIVAPGLYIYTIESGDKKHIGKLAIVR